MFKNKCYNISWIIRILLIVMSFVFILITLVVVALLFTNWGFSSSCSVFEEILESNDLTTILTDLDIDADESMVNILNECVVEGKSGNLSALLDGVNFDDINNFVDGFSVFDKFRKEYEARPRDPLYISELRIAVSNYRNGIKANTDEI